MTELVIIAVVVSFLLFCNGVYVAAEFAIISVNRLALEQQAAEHHWAARILSTVADAARQDRYIAICQVGISLASLGLGMYGEHALAELLTPHLGFLGGHGAATALALAFLTFWHIVAGEMIPKSLALQFPLATARWVDGPMRLTGFLLTPLVFVLNHTGNLILRMLRLPVSQDTSIVYSPAEIRLVFDESREEGQLDAAEHELLLRVLGFGEELVRQWMVPRERVVAVPAGISSQDLTRLIAREQYSRYPVLEGDSVQGVLHAKDLLTGVQVRPISRLSPEDTLEKAFRTITEQRAHMAAVVGASGELLGIVTLADLMERLFGDLKDEFD